MDGFVTDYISTFTAEMGRQPTYEEYSQIMTGFTPDQVPVLNGLARAFGVFDHWFCEVPSQTFVNRSFWTAATSSGLVVNFPVKKWFTGNDAETMFDRLEAHGKTWKVYISEPMQISFTGMIHHQRLKDRLATHFVPFAQFEADAAKGTLPDFSLIEPGLTIGHNDYHPAEGRALGHGVVVLLRLALIDLGWGGLPGPDLRRLPGYAVGHRVQCLEHHPAHRLGRPGGTYDHVPSRSPPARPVPPRPGEYGFTFDRSGYRVPAIVISPWVAEGQVFNEEHRHTSLIATLREQWNLGEAFTARDAAARTSSRSRLHRWPPRHGPEQNPGRSRPPRPVPAFNEDDLAIGKVLSGLGKTFLDGLRQHGEKNDIKLDGLPRSEGRHPPEQIVTLLRSAAAMYFPRRLQPLRSSPFRGTYRGGQARRGG